MMKRFRDVYEDVEAVNVPLVLEYLDYEDGSDKLEMMIPHSLFPYLVDKGVIQLRKGGQTFSSMEEAIDFHKKYIPEATEEDEEEDEQDLGDDKKKTRASWLKGVKWKDEEGNEYDFEAVIGNAKIGTDTIIINMSSAQECMSLALGLCTLGSTGQCYALSPELMRKTAMPYRQRQEHQWHCATPASMAAALCQILKKKSGIKYVRVNQYGEFRNLPDRPDSMKKTPYEKIDYEKILSSEDASDDSKEFAAKLKNIIRRRGMFHPDIIQRVKNLPKLEKNPFMDPDNYAIGSKKFNNQQTRYLKSKEVYDKAFAEIKDEIMEKGEKVVFGDLKKKMSKGAKEDDVTGTEVSPKDTGLTQVDDKQKLKALAAATKANGCQVTFYTYTHRTDLFPPNKKSNLGDNVVINGSGYMIDNAFRPIDYDEFSKLAEVLDSKNAFGKPQGSVNLTIMGLDGQEKPVENATDCVGNCAYCAKCKQSKNLNIYLPVHGMGSVKNRIKGTIKKVVMENPDITKALSDMKLSKEQKMKKIAEVLGVEDKKTIQTLYRTVPDRKEFWNALVEEEELKMQFLQGIMSVANVLGPEMEMPPNTKIGEMGLVGSVNALLGNIQNHIKNNLGNASESTKKKWNRWEQTITGLLQRAKEGEELETGTMPSIPYKKEFLGKFKTLTKKNKGTVPEKEPEPVQEEGTNLKSKILDVMGTNS